MDMFTGRFEHRGFSSLAGLSERVRRCITAPSRALSLSARAIPLRDFGFVPAIKV